MRLPVSDVARLRLEPPSERGSDAAPPRTAVALLVPAPSVADVEAVANAGETMPPKSTFFFPKILDGMVFNQLDPFDP